MIVVSDTTPLNYLILVEAIHILPAIFGRVYAPSAVVMELSHPRSPEVVRAWASSPPGWLTIQDPTQMDSSLKLGPGETAAISLAIEQKADGILIDERKGYKVALQRGLHAITTLGLLEEASHRGLIDFERTLERLDKETTFYVTADVLADYRRRAGKQRRAQDQSREHSGDLTEDLGDEQG
jgi:predicted nucleic acid-binding protein